MKNCSRFLLVIIVCSCAVALYYFASSSRVTAQHAVVKTNHVAAREDAYRQNNLGVALLEQYNYKEGAEAFERALKIDPKLAVAHINLGIAFYNVPDLANAERELKIAAELTPRSPQPYYVLGLIAKAQNRIDDAIANFTQVIKLDARDAGANIQLGQLYAQQRRYAEAIQVFRIALDAEPYNSTALYNLAQALIRSNERAEGQALLARFQSLRQSGAATVIGQNYLEQGRYAEAVTSTGAEPELVNRAAPNVVLTDATAQILPAMKTNQIAPDASIENSIVNNRLSEKARAAVANAHAGGVTLFDMDADGDLDLLEIGVSELRLYRNDNGKYIDATANSGLQNAPVNSIGIAAVAGDYDNDTRPDLFILRYDTQGKSAAGTLLHNEGKGKFTDHTTTAELPAYTHLSRSVAFVDIDHDGDLDLFIAGFADLNAETLLKDASQINTLTNELAPAPNMLLRNNGNGKFTDITASAKVAGETSGRNRAIAVVPTDFDNRRDVDLLLVNYGAPPTLYRNLRDGTFRDVSDEVGLVMNDGGNRFTCVAAGDLNKDGFTDFFFGRANDVSLLVMSDGQARFRVQKIDEKSVDEKKTASGAPPVLMDAAQIFDYDNDGLLDIIAVSDKGLRVWRNLGNEFQESSEILLPKNATANGGWLVRSFASGDVDADGDQDMIFRSAKGELKVARNDGGNRNNSLRLQLEGRVSNRSGVAAKVEARAGSLWQKLETYAASPAPAPADVVFGLGRRTQTDAVRVIWTSGVVQAETEIFDDKTQTANNQNNAADKNKTTASRLYTIIELDRKPSSCPFLFAWNGTAFEFITDFMGGGEMGAWVAPGGVYNRSDSDEYVRLPPGLLREHDGKYDLRVTHELEEVLYVDRLQLVSIAHPRGTNVYPNEGLLAEAQKGLKFYVTRDERPPVAAIDENNNDVLARLERLDRKFVDSFALDKLRGYAETHTLNLNLGDTDANNTLLLLTGWTDYAFSSDNLAAHQAGKTLAAPALQVKNKAGKWQTVIDNVGLPIGRPQTLVVDLSGKFLSDSRDVRLVTNMRIYWDKIAVAASVKDAVTNISRLDPTLANLTERGFSAIKTPDGREPFGYDYERVSLASPWKTLTGSYTRTGDVIPLLTKVDDMFVIARTGDEISLSFDATKLSALPKNWTRTFLFYADGFSKEMDINSGSPDHVFPLPFHAMKKYPYTDAISYPLTPERKAYIEKYNTRVVRQNIAKLK